MLLTKCKCGNFATLDNNFFENRRVFRCPNCQEQLEIGQWTEIQHLPAVLKESGFELYTLPDGTTFDFNFSLKK